jgi:outer membrane protein TolC
LTTAHAAPQIRAQQLLIEAQTLRIESARLQAQAEQRAAEDAYRSAQARSSSQAQRARREAHCRGRADSSPATPDALEHATELWRARMELIDAEHRALRAWVAWKATDAAFLKEVRLHATRP